MYDADSNLVGLIGCHVDDLLVCGSGKLYDEKIQQLRESFPFGSWLSAKNDSVTFCGCEVSQDQHYNIYLTQERYAHGINEINLPLLRKQEPEAEATSEEKRQMKATLGALSWRATQTCPWLAASISILQGKQCSAKVEDLLLTNKLIRTQRQFHDVPVRFSSEIREPILLTYTDASWGCRSDGSSQGGQLTVLADRCVLKGEKSSFSLINWQSRKLARIARSSTSAEVQMASNATDNHEFLKQLLLDWFNPFTIPVNMMDDCMKKIPSVLLLDCKNLYDAMSRIQTSGLQLEEKRTAIEVLSIRERTLGAGIAVKWVDSDQQLADGLSKSLQFDHLIEILQKGILSIVFDSEFVSAKKKRAQQRMNLAKS